MANGNGNLLQRYQVPGLLVLVLGSYGTTLSTTSDRFTGHQGEMLSERVRQVELRIAPIPREIPPPDVRNALNRIESRLDSIEQRLARIDAGGD